MRVLFLNMPFGWIRPSIGVSLLKGHLKRLGIQSRVVYPNLRYAEMVGLRFFHHVAHDAPPQALIGEWIFAPCVFSGLKGREQQYLDMLHSRFRLDPHADITRMVDQLRNARQVAGRFLDEFMTEVEWARYDVVGFSTNFNQTLASIALAHRIKHYFPHIQIVFGGANCEGIMGLQLHRSFPVIDFVCGGEADISFPQLIERLRTGNDVHGIRGVVSRKSGGSFFSDLQPETVKDLDSLPYPEYDDYFGQQHEFVFAPHLRRVLMETSRGCWWGEKSQCTFCGLNGLTMKYRAKSALRALDEMLALTTLYSTSRLEMVDNILDMRYFRDLLPEIRNRGITLDIFYETKANLRKEQIELLSDAGIRTIQPGIESLSTRVLRLMKKGTTALQNVQLLKWCKELGVKCNWNLIYGFPGEVASDYEDITSLMECLHHLEAPTGCGPIRLDRFSPYFETPEHFGFRNVRPDRSYEHVYDLTSQELTNIAYYFEYDCQDEVAPPCGSGMQAAWERWSENQAQSGLVYVDDGATLSFQDYRLGTKHYSTRLKGVGRSLYVFCDQLRSSSAVVREGARLGWTEEGVKQLLHYLLRRRLIVRVDDHLLALAVPAVKTIEKGGSKHEQTQFNESEVNELRQKLERWSCTLNPREYVLVSALLGSQLLEGDKPPLSNNVGNKSES